MIVYAIKHKPTGKFMPLKMTRCGVRGWSNWNPGVRDGFDTTPRIFKDRGSASKALSAWLLGQHTREYTQTADDDYVEVVINYQPNRKREDMEVIQMLLTETSK